MSALSNDMVLMTKHPTMVMTDLGPVYNALAVAKGRFEGISNIEIIFEVIPHWTAWVIDVNRVWSRLGEVMTMGKYAAMYGRLKKERKDDPLLQYVYQSRHHAEHRSDPLAEITCEFEPMGAPIEGFEFYPIVTDNFGVTQRSGGGPVRAQKMTNLEFKFLPVVNEGVTFDPPRTHLGRPLTDHTPSEYSTLVMAYLENQIEAIKSELISDARKRAGMPPL